MDDVHLYNTIALLKRSADTTTLSAIYEGESMLCMLQGEMAIDCIERDLDSLMTNGIDPSEITPLYDNLIMEKDRRKNMNFFVAGVKHHKFYEIAEELKEGEPVQLIPEPTNKYDKFAVKIEALGTMLGYVPAKLSEEVSKMLAVNETLSAEIISLSLELEPWYALKIEIKEED